jgi:uncharacterized membrane protein YedE/YeeE
MKGWNMEIIDYITNINIYALIIGLIFGAVAQRTQFCFSGSIKDYILTSSTRRTASVVFAIIIAIVSTQIIAYFNEIDLKSTIYYKDNINYFSIILGGVLFGIGMMLADGCSSRHLIKFAQGDKYSLITFIFIAIFAYAATRGIFYDLLHLLTANETLINISSYINNFTINIYLILSLLLVYLFILIKKIKRIFALYDGFIIGLLVAATWYITGILSQEYMESIVNLSSITFVYPSAKTLEYIMSFKIIDISFSVSMVLGVFVGAFIHSLFNKKYSFGCTSNLKNSRLKSSMFGGALMGTGGVLAIGCTVGQGLSGLSTLAFASFVALVSILSSAYITAKYLNKKNALPMCFIFEWDSNTKDKK